MAIQNITNMELAYLIVRALNRGSYVTQAGERVDSLNEDETGLDIDQLKALGGFEPEGSNIGTVRLTPSNLANTMRNDNNAWHNLDSALRDNTLDIDTFKKVFYQDDDYALEAAGLLFQRLVAVCDVMDNNGQPPNGMLSLDKLRACSTRRNPPSPRVAGKRGRGSARRARGRSGRRTARRSRGRSGRRSARRASGRRSVKRGRGRRVSRRN